MKRLILGIAVALLAMGLKAQTTKTITLSNKTPYADAIVLKNSAGDVNVTATFVFDEDANTVSLSLTSDRKLFVFWDDITYRKVFHYRKLRTDRLPYTLVGNTSDEFRCARHFRRALPKPRRKYQFHTWASSEGMQTVDAERKIVNDSICQVYTLSDTRIDVSVRLRDLLLLDEVQQKGVARYYELSYGGDPNIVYAISLQRNPCIGMERDIQSASNALSAIRRSYDSFKALYDKGVVNSEEGEKMFHELQEALQIQFPLNEDSSACPASQQAFAQYNQLTDSIRSISVTLHLPAAEVEMDHSVNAKTIRANARMIDSNVARWLVTKDEMERTDLVSQCRNIIADTNEMITKNGTRTQEERNAVAVFRKAEQYFKRTCR